MLSSLSRATFGFAIHSFALYLKDVSRSLPIERKYKPKFKWPVDKFSEANVMLESENKDRTEQDRADSGKPLPVAYQLYLTQVHSFEQLIFIGLKKLNCKGYVMLLRDLQGYPAFVPHKALP